MSLLTSVSNTKSRLPLLPHTSTQMSTSSSKRAQEDNRNLSWKSDNVGNKLLEKMGWKNGQGLGKRHRESTTSTEGLRLTKRQDGLGLGAQQTGSSVHEHNHVQQFTDLLRNLQKQNDIDADNADQPNKRTKKQKSLKSKTKKQSAIILPTSKMTHRKIREAKFQEKSVDDLKCIFAGCVDDAFGLVVGENLEQSVEQEGAQKRNEKLDKRHKKTKNKL